MPDDPGAQLYCGPVDDALWERTSLDAEAAMLEAINGYRRLGTVCGDRAALPTDTLPRSASLDCAARNHALDMDQRDFFGGETPDGEWVEDRVGRAAYPADRIVWESVSAGASDPRAVVDLWMANEDHCAWLMDPLAFDLGLGAHVADDDGEGGEGDDPYGHYWVAIVGAAP